MPALSSAAFAVAADENTGATLPGGGGGVLSSEQATGARLLAAATRYHEASEVVARVC
jgi:hypothetical protein